MGVNHALSWALSVRWQMPCAVCVAAEWECVRVALVHGCNFTITKSIRGIQMGCKAVNHVRRGRKLQVPMQTHNCPWCRRPVHSVRRALT